jgi:hypothetical protein
MYVTDICILYSVWILYCKLYVKEFIHYNFKAVIYIKLTWIQQLLIYMIFEVLTGPNIHIKVCTLLWPQRFIMPRRMVGYIHRIDLVV